MFKIRLNIALLIIGLLLTAFQPLLRAEVCDMMLQNTSEQNSNCCDSPKNIPDNTIAIPLATSSDSCHPADSENEAQGECPGCECNITQFSYSAQIAAVSGSSQSLVVPAQNFITETVSPSSEFTVSNFLKAPPKANSPPSRVLHCTWLI